MMTQTVPIPRRHTIYLVLCVFGLVAMLALPHFHLGVRWYTAHRAIEMTVILIAGCLALKDILSERHERIIASRWRLIILISLFAYMIAVSLWSEYPVQSLQDSGRFAGLALVCYWLCFAYRNTCIDPRWFYLLLIPCFYYSVYFLLFYFDLLLIERSFTSNAVPAFSNVRQLNGLQVLVLPLLAYILTHVRQTHQRRLLVGVAYFVMVVWVVIAIYSGGRSLLLSLAAAWLVVNCYPQVNMKPISRFWIKLLLLAVSLYAVFFVLVPLLAGHAANSNLIRSGSSGRIALWLFSLEHVRECLFGCGGQAFPVFSTREYYWPFGSPHNMFLVVLLEYGVGALSLVGVLVICMFKYMAEALKQFSTEARFFVAAFVGVLVDSLFSGNIYTPVVGIVLPLVVARIYLLVGTKKVYSGSAIAINGYLNLVFSVLCFGMLVLSIIATMIDFRYNFAELNKLGLAFPRFYEHGNFFVD